MIRNVLPLPLAIIALGCAAATAGAATKLGTTQLAQRSVRATVVKKVVVRAADDWVDTGVTARAGEKISIRATGRWKMGPTCTETGPDGAGLRPNLLCSSTGREPLKGVNFSTLIGRIGRHGPPFAIGRYRVVRGRTGGRLYLRSNSAATYDNTGQVVATVERGGRPQGDDPRLMRLVKLCTNPNPRTAIPACTQALRYRGLLSQNRAHLYYNRGFAYMGVKRYRKAISDLNQAISLNPNHARAYAVRGACYADLNQTRRALADFDHVIRRLEADRAARGAAFWGRGAMHERLGNKAAAIADYRAAVRLLPANTKPYRDAKAGLKRLGAQP